MDIAKQVKYWQEGAAEEIKIAQELHESSYWRQSLFFLHLGLEKIIKAHVSRHIKDIAPRTHNLVRLAQKSGIEPGHGSMEILGEINMFQMEGRYPGSVPIVIDEKMCRKYLKKGQEVYTWYRERL